jgi:hypothetical protein
MPKKGGLIMTKEKNVNSGSKPKEKREFLDIVGDIATVLIIPGILVCGILELLGVINLIPG